MVDTPTQEQLIDDIASQYDGIGGVSLHQLAVLVEAHAEARGGTVFGYDSVIVRPDGHVLIRDLTYYAPYDWRHTHTPNIAAAALLYYDIPITDTDTIGGTIAAVIDHWDPDTLGDRFEEALDDRVRDHPALIMPIRAARAAGVELALTDHELAKLDDYSYTWNTEGE